MDLNSLDIVKEAAKGATLELHHPVTGDVLTYTAADGTKKPMTLVLIGKDSEDFRHRQRQLIDKRVKRQMRNRGNSSPSTEDMEREGMSLLATAVCGGTVFLDGAEIPVTSDNAADLFTRFPWMREQADAFVEDRANFLLS